MSVGRIEAICISEKRGTRKHEIDTVNLVSQHGLEGDAHAGKWHRQVSFLRKEDIERFKEEGANVRPGDFGENFIISGLDKSILKIGATIYIGDSKLRISQIGKECHDHCAIYYSVGRCVMPESGYFCEVETPGTVRVGDEVRAEYVADDIPLRAAVITLSDRASEGTYEDRSGKVIEDILTAKGYEIIERIILPDDFEKLRSNLVRLCDQRFPDLILTTGGTGFSRKDITPEATIAVADRNVPGIAEAIRNESMKITKNAMLSRAVSVIRKNTLIINLPGSPKACAESIDVFIDTIPHGLFILKGELFE